MERPRDGKDALGLVKKHKYYSSQNSQGSAVLYDQVITRMDIVSIRLS